MDAAKFLVEFNRMCKSFSNTNCEGCIREKHYKPCNIGEMNPDELCELVADVEQWSKEHPQKTRQQDFLEKFPKAETNNNGTPKACCKHLGYTMDCPTRSSCKECWNKPMEEDDK